MNEWTRWEDIRRALDKRWQKGELLRAWLEPEQHLPLRIPLKRPAARDLGERFTDAQAWVAYWVEKEKNQKGAFELEWTAVNHRQIGRNSLPIAVVFPRPEQPLRSLAKDKDAARYKHLIVEVESLFPELHDWLRQKPLTVLERAAHWPRLLAVLDWLRDYPQPRIYIRQLEIPGVDTKFIEQQKGLLTELLDRILPETAIAGEARGAANFEQRYGFCTKPPQIRFRILDPSFYIHGLSDLQIPLADFSQLDLEIRHVFITENDINGLAFPPMRAAIVIFGLGYGIAQLSHVSWLQEKLIFYWGDIDTHGFIILDRLRHHFPHVRSLLMDRATLIAHRDLWGEELKPSRRPLNHLEPDEESLYEDIVQDRLAPSLRMEQERVNFVYVKDALAHL